MTTLQKTLTAATLAALIGAAIHEARRASQSLEQNQALLEQQSPLSEQIRQLQRERDEATSRLAEVNAENARLKAGQSSTEVLALRGEVGVLRQLLASSEAKSNSPSASFSKMLSDPAMREYIHQTQLNMIKANFGSLFKELKLTPEQTEKVVQLMGDQFMKNTDKMYALTQGTLSAAEIAQAKGEREAELEKQLQPLLGEAGCARLKEFHEEFPAHATVDLLNGQLGASQLTEEQGGRLFQLVKAEPYDLTRGIAGDWDPAFWGSQDDIDKHLSKVAESNQRIIQQAGGFLTPDQLAALNTVLTSSVNERIAQAAALIPKR